MKEDTKGFIFLKENLTRGHIPIENSQELYLANTVDIEINYLRIHESDTMIQSYFLKDYTSNQAKPCLELARQINVARLIQSLLILSNF